MSELNKFNYYTPELINQMQNKVISSILNRSSPFLKQVCEPVQFPLSNQTKQQISNLKTAFRHSFQTHRVKTLGLAAPQIGVTQRFFIMPVSIDYGMKSLRILKASVRRFIVYINPIILSFGQETIAFEQTCLSMGHEIYSVKRPKKIQVEYFNEDGQKISEAFDGIRSRVFQHERDHLDGINMDEIGDKYQMTESQKKWWYDQDRRI